MPTTDNLGTAVRAFLEPLLSPPESDQSLGFQCFFVQPPMLAHGLNMAYDRYLLLSLLFLLLWSPP